MSACEVVQLQQIYCYNRIVNLIDKAGDTMCSASVKSITIYGTKYYCGSVLLYGIGNDRPLFGHCYVFNI